MVEVSLTRYLAATQSRELLESPTSYDRDQPILRAAAVSDFGFLRVASFWKDGVPQRPFPGYQRRTLDVDVSRSTTTFYRARHQITEDEKSKKRRFLIPPFTYPIPFSKSWLVALPLSGTPSTLLVPCSEVFRFYYCGASGKFGTAILDGTYYTRRSKIVNEAASSWPDSEGVAILRRGGYVNDDDVLEIARTTFSPYARMEADLIFTRMVGPRARRELQARLPFEGRTRLVVRGVAFDGLLGPTFLAFIIESCSGPMPFRHLIYERDNEQHPNEPKGGGSEKFQKTGTLRAPPPLPRDDIPHTQQNDPNAEERATMLRGLLNSDRYKADYDVTYRPRDAVATIRPGTRRRDEKETGDPYASGTRVVGAAAHPAEFTLDDEPERQPAPELKDFELAIAELKAQRRDLNVGGVEIVAFPVGRIVNGEGPNRRIWPFLDGRQRKLRRHAAVAIVLTETNLHVLVEIERKQCTPDNDPEYFQTIDFIGNHSLSLAVSDVRELLAYLVRYRGSITKGTRTMSIAGRPWRIDGLRHPSEPHNAVSRAAAIYRKVSAR